MRGPRLVALDVLRALAILAVLLDHFGSPNLGTHQVARVAFMYVGDAGVGLFFSLSGYLIGRILLGLQNEGPSWPALGAFWCRRWFRTLPVYWLLLTYASLLSGTWDRGAYIFLQNFHFAKAQVLIVAWSLVLEEWFYLSYPLLMHFTDRLAPLRRLVRREHTLLAICLALILACHTARLAAIHYWAMSVGNLQVNPFLRMDCCAYGLLAAWVCQYHRTWITGLSDRVRGAVLAVATAVVVAWGWMWVAVLTVPGAADRVHLAEWGSLMVDLNAMLVPAMAAPVIALLATRCPAPAGRRIGLLGQVAVYISAISYSLYLCHVVVMVLSALHFPERNNAGVLATSLVVLASFALATILRAVVEVPALRLRDWLVPDRRAARELMRPAMPAPGRLG
jgi:peptidoglycan/LPS O-acetylase OafA/YrhL